MKRITAKDIAEHFGISRTVVSNVVNKKPDGVGNVRISPELRKQIEEYCNDINYRPNRLAQGLKSTKNRLIGVITIQSPYEISVMKTQAVCKGLRQSGYEYLLYEIDGVNVREQSEFAMNMLADYHVGGVVLVSIWPYRDLIVEMLKSSEIPTVEIMGGGEAVFPSVVYDMYDASYRMAQAVIKTGRKNLVIVTHLQRPPAVPSVSGRIQGILKAAAQAGVQCKEFSLDTTEAAHDLKLGYRSTQAMLNETSPDAVFYANDLLAIGGLKALKENGLQVPEDVALCAFDGLEITAYTDPPITTAHQPVELLAQKSIDLLMNILENGVEHKPEVHHIPCRIVLRRSSGHS